MTWRDTLKTWTKPASDTEESKADNAARMIGDAIRDSGRLGQRQYTVYPTGSYRNNTNLRLGSDVDIAIVYEGASWHSLPAGMTPAQFGFTAGGAQYGLQDFRRDVEAALKDKFGSDVSPGNKTFTITGNSYRLPADVTPFLVHRRYTGRSLADGRWECLVGVETRPRNDTSRRIINWHQEHYDSGVIKNRATSRRYKRAVRVLKRLREHILDNGSSQARIAARPIPSFLVECLVYNAPDASFVSAEPYEVVHSVVTKLWNATKDDQRRGG